MVERLDGIEEVARSIRVGSTTYRGDILVACFAAGFVAGEGCFLRTHRRSKASGNLIPRYKFAVTVARRDRRLLEQLRDVLGCGRLWDLPAGQRGHEPLARFEVNRLADLRERVLPFMDSFLLPSAKRGQYERWRTALVDDAASGTIGRRRGRCSEPECDELIRGRGLCRSHYYRATGC